MRPEEDERQPGVRSGAPAGKRVVLVFLDGVGIGTGDEGVNPFARALARGVVPTLLKLMGGSLPTLEAPAHEGPHGSSFPLDATLGLPGTPQSGTGQATLLTGVNAAALYGRHFGPWVPVRIRPVVEERNLLSAALRSGHLSAFANAYPRGWPGPKGGRRVAGPPLAALTAGLMDRHEDALAQGEAVSSEIVNDGWRRHLGFEHIPDVSEEQAGRTLARISAGVRLTMFAHYATDTAGHRGGMDGAVAALERVDRFLSGLLTDLSSDTTLLVASDHGNLEDVTAQHTRNPVLGMAHGPWAPTLRRLRSIADVTPALLALLDEPVR